MPANFAAPQGFALLSQPRTWLKVAGDDAGMHLQRFCTNDVTTLTPNQGAEAMFLNAKGKLVGFVEVFRLEDHWLLFGAGEQTQTLSDHLDRYVIREDVCFETNHSPSYAVLIGLDPEEILGQKLAPSDSPQIQRLESLDGWAIQTREFGPQAWIIAASQQTINDLAQQSSDRGWTSLEGRQLDAVRLHEAYPHMGIDIGTDNLPQELGRDDAAISFHKGCYLGQETVARIDALGHVNRHVVKIAGTGTPPESLPVELRRNNQPVGQLTSAQSAGSNLWLGIGTVKRGNHSPDTSLAAGDFEATVAD